MTEGGAKRDSPVPDETPDETPIESPAEPEVEATENGDLAPPDPAAQGLPRYVTKLTPIEQQVGEHVIAALHHAETVAVLTTTVIDPAGQQHIVSVPLTPEMLGHVQQLLRAAVTPALDQRVPCVGFHCFLKDTDLEDE